MLPAAKEIITEISIDKLNIGFAWTTPAPLRCTSRFTMEAVHQNLDDASLVAFGGAAPKIVSVATWNILGVDWMTGPVITYLFQTVTHPEGLDGTATLSTDVGGYNLRVVITQRQS